MSQQTSPPLNQGQQAAADGFFQFLMGTQKEMIISGAGGYGKTFLMGKLIDEVLPHYHQTCALLGIKAEYQDVVMTAMTNQAADVLSQATGRPAQTIHSFMNLKVVDDYDTGVSKLTKTRDWRVHQNVIIFIDECSMIDSKLLTYLMEGTLNCKIVYVGDDCQMAPIKEEISPIYRKGLLMFELTEPMRNAGQPALMALCNQFRNTVRLGGFKDIQIVPGVIDYLTSDQMEQLINSTFMNQGTSSRILAYSNNRAIQYNEYIRGMRNLGGEFTVGEILVNNSAIRLSSSMISVDQTVTIVEQEDHTEHHTMDGDGTTMEIRRSTLQTPFGGLLRDVPIPVDKNHFLALLKHYARVKEWSNYYNLKNNYPDLRLRESSTVHKAQGQTLDSVFIDLNDISNRCHNPKVASRLLYVAVSRPRNRIYLYGDLNEKYGSIIL